jgi:uroporphyrinogen decarboxylase
MAGNTEFCDVPPMRRGEPEFGNLLSVLRKGVPDRPTLFEFYLNHGLEDRLVKSLPGVAPAGLTHRQKTVLAFYRAGYDYATIAPSFCFPKPAQAHKETLSLNEGTCIADRASFDAYEWPDPDSYDLSEMDAAAEALRGGMKLIVSCPGGVLENVIALVGYENLCYLIADDEQLAFDLFEAVGSRLVRFQQRVLGHPATGACMCNDDWGFKTQTMLSPRDLRRFVFPWHRQMVEVAHAAGKPAILHSCGHFERIIDDIIDDLCFDGRHSYEDAIMPVEQAYERYSGRIAILGGMDIDFVCRSTPEEVHQRSRAMLAKSGQKGGYALGTGNSVPSYVPDAAYFAMISAALAAA